MIPQAEIQEVKQSAVILGLFRSYGLKLKKKGNAIQLVQRVIQKLLGHGNLSSTQGYTRVRNRQLVNLLEEYHPRG